MGLLSNQKSRRTNQTIMRSTSNISACLFLGIVASTFAAQNNQIETSFRFCALTSNGAVVDTGRMETRSEADADWTFAYGDKEVLAYAYEVCFYDDVLL